MENSLIIARKKYDCLIIASAILSGANGAQKLYHLSWKVLNIYILNPVLLKFMAQVRKMWCY